VFRYGGEELAIIMPETDSIGAAPVCEKIRTAIEEEKIHIQEKEISVTTSVGHVSWTDGTTKERMVSACDAALYRAKQEGRNRICEAERG
jgi:diguanylate cyclase (GGDEF)-like protein